LKERSSERISVSFAWIIVAFGILLMAKHQTGIKRVIYVKEYRREFLLRTYTLLAERKRRHILKLETINKCPIILLLERRIR
jgi:hypothetical protein